MLSSTTIDEARQLLTKHFGYQSFRPGQEQVIRAALAGKDVLAVMPTGAGKSICYQVPAAALSGLTIVVSPLISLMSDQVRALKEVGIRGSFFNSTLKPHVRPEVLRRALNGWYDLMYVSPERLQDPAFRAFALRAHINLVAVDEAHCVSQWGQDFRPAYRDIREFVELLPKRPPLMALTATATSQVRTDILSMLGLQNPDLLMSGFDRPNLHLASFELTPKQRERWLVNYVSCHPADPGIVYATTRKQVEKLAAVLAEAGVRVASYHAGMTHDARTASQQAFVNDDVQLIVATNAFGMGIDKSNVRFVVNCGLPQTLEEYYQEAGRAGRDGEPAECYLLWSKGDIRTCHFFIDNTEYADDVSYELQQELIAHREHLLGEMIGYAMSTSCLHRRILRYFGQPAGEDIACGGCSVCKEERAEQYVKMRRSSGKKLARAVPEEEPWATSAEDEALFQRLRVLRKTLADEASVPPYVVFSDKTLRAMVRMRPHTSEDLLEVKLERYGKAFLVELEA